MNTEKPTSIKEAFQSMIPENSAIILGVVVKTYPLEIQVVNNKKMVISGKNLVIPMQLTDYSTSVDISVSSSDIDSVTRLVSDHVHSLRTFNIQSASMKVYNSLKLNELVSMVRFENGKQYLVIDRVVME